MRATFGIAVAFAAVTALSGCGRSTVAMPRQPNMAYRPAPTAPATASAVAPDDPAILTEDTRRAVHWSADAVRVLAIHTTGLNTLQVSASANVYFSAARFHDYKPCVFVARRFGFKSLAQYGEVSDYSRLVANLKPLPSDVPVSAKIAFNVARQAPASGNCPAGATCPPPAPRNFSSTRALLVNTGTEAPAWWLYGSGQKFTVNAQTREMSAPEPQSNPNDPLSKGLDVDLQRAAAIFLPANVRQANERKEPKAGS